MAYGFAILASVAALLSCGCLLPLRQQLRSLNVGPLHASMAETALCFATSVGGLQVVCASETRSQGSRVEFQQCRAHTCTLQNRTVSTPQQILGCKKGTLHAGCCARTPFLNSFKLGSASGAAPSRYGVFEVNVRIEQDSTSHERHDSRLLLKAPCLQLPAAILHG